MTPLETLRQMVGKATPGPWAPCLPEDDLVSIRTPMDGDVDADGRWVTVGNDEICTMADRDSDIDDAAHIVTADRLSRFLVSPEAVEEVAICIRRDKFRRTGRERHFDAAMISENERSEAAAVLQLLATKALGGEG